MANQKRHIKQLKKQSKEKKVEKKARNENRAEYEKTRVDKRKKEKKMKIGVIQKTGAQTVYKRDKPWKSRYVIPVEKKDDHIVSAKTTAIDEEALSKSESKRKKLKEGKLKPLEHEYAGLPRKSAVTTDPHRIPKEKVSEYKGTGSKLKTDDLKSVRKHIKK